MLLYAWLTHWQWSSCTIPNTKYLYVNISLLVTKQILFLVFVFLYVILYCFSLFIINILGNVCLESSLWKILKILIPMHTHCIIVISLYVKSSRTFAKKKKNLEFWIKDIISCGFLWLILWLCIWLIVLQKNVFFSATGLSFCPHT